VDAKILCHGLCRVWDACMVVRAPGPGTFTRIRLVKAETEGRERSSETNLARKSEENRAIGAGALKGERFMCVA
jgi:hypothetical protein